MLKQRVITALVLIPLVVSLLFLAPFGVISALFLLIVALGAWEWSALSGVQQPAARVTFVLLVAVLSLLIIFTLRMPQSSGLFIAGLLFCGLLWWCLAAWKVYRYQRGIEAGQGSHLVRLGIGLCVLLPTLTAVLLLLVMGPAYLLLLFVIIWGADSAAYFSGRRFGRRKLASRVSPGKSWEGVIGGLLFVLVVYLLIDVFTSLPLPAWLPGLLLVTVTVLVSVLGDLTESLYKRISGLKDSGSLLPGHGGVLDRIDSLTAAAPVFLVGLELTGSLA